MERNGRSNAKREKSAVSASINTESRLSKVRKSAHQSHSSRNKSNRKKKPCQENCKKHEFELKPIAFSSFLSKGLTQPIHSQFCTKGNSTTLPIISQQLLKQPQVPLFILEDEIHRYKHYMEAHRGQFQDAKKKATKLFSSDQQDEIIIPIPKNKNCQICRVKIETEDQYTKHVASVAHMETLRRSFGQKLIEEETQLFSLELKTEREILGIQERLGKVSRILGEAKKTLKGLLLKR